jgi:hypothetical protein
MPAIADVAARDLVNSWVMPSKVLGARTDELGEKLLFAGGLAAKNRIIESYFRNAGLEATLPQGPVRQCAAAVDAAHGSIRVDELAHHAGMSTRTLGDVSGAHRHFTQDFHQTSGSSTPLQRLKRAVVAQTSPTLPATAAISTNPIS